MSDTVTPLVVSVTAAPNPAKGLSTVTISMSGLTPSAAHNVTILGPAGHNQTTTVTTDGTGAATVRFVPQVSGNHTVNVYQATQTVAGTTTFVASGN
jgi:hypothetical protein